MDEERIAKLIGEQFQNLEQRTEKRLQQLEQRLEQRIADSSASLAKLITDIRDERLADLEARVRKLESDRPAA